MSKSAKKAASSIEEKTREQDTANSASFKNRYKQICNEILLWTEKNQTRSITQEELGKFILFEDRDEYPEIEDKINEFLLKIKSRLPFFALSEKRRARSLPLASVKRGAQRFGPSLFNFFQRKKLWFRQARADKLPATVSVEWMAPIQTRCTTASVPRGSGCFRASHFI